MAFRISGVFSNVFDLLIKFGEALIDGQAHEAQFLDESGGCAWRLTPVPDQQHTMLFEVYEFEQHAVENEKQRTDIRLKIAFVVKRRQLAKLIVGELWKEATLSREPSYQRDRERVPCEDYMRFLQRWREWTSGHSRLPDTDLWQE